jgi:hypothetical protein
MFGSHVTTLFSVSLLIAVLSAGGCSKKTEPAQAAAMARDKTGAQANPRGAPASDQATEAAQTDAAAFVPAPKGATLTFKSPIDGAVIEGPATAGKVTVHVAMGVTGLNVQAAGKVTDGVGHYHLVVTRTAPQGDAPTRVRYGSGQTKTDLELEPGSYTLRLQFANGAGQVYGPKFAKAITVSVKIGAPKTPESAEDPAAASALEPEEATQPVAVAPTGEVPAAGAAQGLDPARVPETAKGPAHIAPEATPDPGAFKPSPPAKGADSPEAQAEPK